MQTRGRIWMRLDFDSSRASEAANAKPNKYKQKSHTQTDRQDKIQIQMMLDSKIDAIDTNDIMTIYIQLYGECGTPPPPPSPRSRWRQRVKCFYCVAFSFPCF